MQPGVEDLDTALEYLIEARYKLWGWPKTPGRFNANRHTTCAIIFVRYALKRLEQEEEETCEKS